ncbi:sugar isomerase [Lipingzhangella sp. LS1_29]|uniref:Sugar isomerase n=1 Tax=Lipingzhangella rawalii TaxID=2055835 RepID=A0ABU2H221_9ACTN|nr:sugar isomerase [Lipingzhangella rawalii]MDS1269352.1 sugar isomerase [Lipingzhangella rawalii]
MTLTAQHLADELAGKPAALNRLAQRLSRVDPFRALPGLIEDGPDEVVLLGLGAARYAAGPIVDRLRQAGLPTRTESPAARRLGPAGPGTLVVAVVVAGGQRELAPALDHYAGGSPIVLVTPDVSSPLTSFADVLVPLEPGEDTLACRTFQHAQAMLLHLASRLGAAPAGASADVSVLVRRAANATADLVERAPHWVGQLAERLSGPGAIHLLAPVERLSSAQQGALAVRRGPVRAAHASETAEWAHTDRYLAATQRYQALLLRGSRYDERAMDQILQLRGTVVTVGGELEGQATGIRYSGDGDEDVALLTEPVIPELLAEHWWSQREVGRRPRSGQAVPRTQEA